MRLLGAWTLQLSGFELVPKTLDSRRLFGVLSTSGCTFFLTSNPLPVITTGISILPCKDPVKITGY